MSNDLQWLFPGCTLRIFKKVPMEIKKHLTELLTHSLEKAIQNASDAKWPINFSKKVKLGYRYKTIFVMINKIFKNNGMGSVVKAC